MRLRRQWESGKLTDQEYAAGLNVVQNTPPQTTAPAPLAPALAPQATAPALPAAAENARETAASKPDPKATQPRPKLVGAVELLQLRRRLDQGQLTPQEYLSQLNAEPDVAHLPVPEPITEAGPFTTPKRAAKPEPVTKPKPVTKLEPLIKAVPASEAASVPQLEPVTKLERLIKAGPVTKLEPVSRPAPEPLPTATPTVSATKQAEILADAAQAAPQGSLATKRPVAPDNLIRWWKPRLRNYRLRWPLAAAGGVFLLIAALQAPAFHEFTGRSRKIVAQDTTLTAPEVLPADLIVAEAGFIGPAGRRRISGALKNRSGRPYSDVHLTFSLVGTDGDTVGTATATVDHIGGHETARFEAPDVKPKTVELVLHDIETHPQPISTP